MKRTLFVFFFLITLSLSRALFVTSYASMEIDAEGYVTNVVDGDTLDVSNFGRIRLADIDAPESYENGYDEAKNYLRDLVDNKLVYIDKDPELSYGRFVCVIYMRWNSTHLFNVNKALLNEGVAEIWDYPNEFNPSTWSLYVYYPESDSNGGDGSGDDGGNGGEVPSDTTAPIIGNVAVNPSSGSAGTEFMISVAVSDPSGVKTVIGYIQNPDGINIATVTLTDDDNNGIYTGLWYGTGASIGTYWIDIVATDNYDNSIEGNNLVSCAVSKSTTMILCSVSSSSLTIGTPLTISGSITPTLGGKIVTLTYMKPDGFTFTRTCTTNNGEYSDTYTPDMLGSWRVSASWVGDATHEGATSSSKAFTVSKLSSSISCSVSSSSLMIGDSVTVSGSLIPPLSGKVVTLTYMKPDGFTFTRTCITNPGDYTDTYTPDSTGAWSVRASWDGDPIYKGASSSEIEFTVSKISSALTCSISSSAITIENSITVSGSLSPKREGITVTLMYIKPNNDAFSRTVTTDSEGFYSDSYEPDVEGIWSVNADWEEDETYMECNSPFLSFILDGTPPTISITTPSIGSEIKSPDITISWSGEDALSGIANYEIKVDDDDWICPVGTETSCSLTGLHDGTHIVSIKAIDVVGNLEVEQINFTVNTSLIGGPGWIDDIAVIGGIGITLVSLFIFIRLKTARSSI